MLYHQAISVEQANKQSRSVVQHIESIRDQVKRYQTVRAGHVLSSLVHDCCWSRDPETPQSITQLSLERYPGKNEVI